MLIIAIAAFCEVKLGLLFIIGLKQFFIAVIAVILSILVDLILPPLFNKVLFDFQVVKNSGDYGIDKIGNGFWIEIE